MRERGSRASYRTNVRSRRRAFTLVEVLVVVVILAILAGIAIPTYIDFSDEARAAADNASLGGIRTSLVTVYMYHRRYDSPSGEWISSVNDIPSVMMTGSLPAGMSIVGPNLIDQRGNLYTLNPETATQPARIEIVP